MTAGARGQAGPTLGHTALPPREAGADAGMPGNFLGQWKCYTHQQVVVVTQVYTSVETHQTTTFGIYLHISLCMNYTTVKKKKKKKNLSVFSDSLKALDLGLQVRLQTQ